MRLDFVDQLGVAATLPEPSTYAGGGDSNEGQHGAPLDHSSSRRLTIATVRAQLSASAASCFRPARVIA